VLPISHGDAGRNDGFIAAIIRSRMIGAGRSSDSILKERDIEVFEKPRPKKKRVLKKSPAPLRKDRNSKARKKPR
jgi:hypothetical protein